jgi:hypothetical protein
MSYISFLTRGVHDLHLLLIEWLMDVNFWTIFISISKAELTGKFIIRYTIPITLGHPVHLAYISSLLHIQSCKELGYV